jgi:hypothetical protein
MYGMDAGMGGMMKKIAAKKAKKKDESGTSKIGKMLEKKEMEQAPRRPSVTKMKPTKMIMTKEMRNKSNLKFKPSGSK